MKKLIITIIVMSLVIGIFTSCENGNKNNNNETGNSECLIVDYTNNNIDGAITKEYTFWQYDRYLDSVAPQTKAILYDGTTYNGQYKYSYIEKYFPFSLNMYEDDNDVRFVTRSVDDKLVMLSLMSNQFFDTEPLLDELENPREETEQIARALAQQYVDNLDEYVVEVDEPDYSPSIINGKTYDLTYYQYIFRRVIDEVDTMDYFRIIVTSKGNIACMSGIGLGMMKPYKNYKIPKEKCREVIEQKLNEIYGEHPAVYKGYEIDNQYFTLAEDNRLVLCTKCKVNLEYEENDWAFSTGVELIIFLDEIISEN